MPKNVVKQSTKKQNSMIQDNICCMYAYVIYKLNYSAHTPKKLNINFQTLIELFSHIYKTPI